jgi:hypothetical protein
VATTYSVNLETNTWLPPLSLQLVSEMRKLGAVIVAAHFGTVIIATGKRNMAAAVG